MRSNTIRTAEPGRYPPEVYFPPSELLSTVDDAFEHLRQRQADVVAGHIGAIALKAIPDCNFRCAKDPGIDMGYDCYEYTDDTWQELPERMPDNVLRETGVRIGEYTKATDMLSMQIIFHGGEPLFTHDAAGYYDHAIDILEEGVRSVNENVILQYGMHTNASLLTQSTLGVIKRRNIVTSCSIDGNEEAHNRNRKTSKHGLGTFRTVDRGIRRLSQPCHEECASDCDTHFNKQFSGLLAVIDLRNDPIETYEQLCSYNPKRIDFLLPYANHDNPPARIPGENSPTPYADWLLVIHRRWIADQEAGKQVPDIRQFSSIANRARGLPSSTEAIGPLTSSVAFVRADGSFEGLDAFKTASRETVETNMNVFDNSIEDVARHLRTIGQLGKKSVAAACSDCKLLEICGGGHLESRYSAENEFDNASVFCEDLKVLIKEIVATTNAKYCSEVAGSKLRAAVRQTPEKRIPSNLLPLYEPTHSSSTRKLAIRIRPAEGNDLTQITDLHGDAYFASFSNVVPPDILDAHVSDDFLPRKYDYWQHQIESARHSPVDRLFVATLGSKVLGFSALKLLDLPDVALLNAHYVSTQVEGYGVESELLAEIERTIGHPLVIRAQATAQQSSQATHLHESGFVVADFPTQKLIIRDHLLELQPLERRPYNMQDL